MRRHIYFHAFFKMQHWEGKLFKAPAATAGRPHDRWQNYGYITHHVRVSPSTALRFGTSLLHGVDVLHTLPLEQVNDKSNAKYGNSQISYHPQIQGIAGRDLNGFESSKHLPILDSCHNGG